MSRRNVHQPRYCDYEPERWFKFMRILYLNIPYSPLFEDI